MKEQTFSVFWSCEAVYLDRKQFEKKQKTSGYFIIDNQQLNHLYLIFISLLIDEVN